MSRKDYVATAEIVSHLDGGDVRWQMATEFADYFELDNPNFDRARFFAAAKAR